MTTYKQSHDQSTTSAHAHRTAQVEAAFVLEKLTPTTRLLDIGCGPGSITAGLARLATQGSAIGIDISDQVLEQARNSHSADNVTYEMGNVLDGLKYEDGSFDIVFCNQTLLHIPDPVRAMKEMRRVCKVGGIIAAREADMPFHWYPYNRGLQLWDKYTYTLIFGSDDREYPMNLPHPQAYRGGSLLHVWARQAGFDPGRMDKGVGIQSINTPEERAWWVETYSARLKEPFTRDKLVGLGASLEDIKEMIAGLEEWGRDVDGWLAIIQGELIAYK
jgi:ubiquinone/menaquinone biosynthesis C-methylase UbiE